MLVFEVASRYIFGSPTIWAHELSQLIFGPYIVLGGAYVLYAGAHINMEVLHKRLCPRRRAIVDLLTSLLFFFFLGVLTWKGIEWGRDAILQCQHSQTAWGPPIYFTKATVPVAAALMLLQGMAKTVRDFAIATRRRKLV